MASSAKPGDLNSIQDEIADFIVNLPSFESLFEALAPVEKETFKTTFNNVVAGVGDKLASCN